MMNSPVRFDATRCLESPACGGVVGPPGEAGFTLVELLVVIAIIVVLLALLTPALDKAIYQAELMVCGAKQHTIGLGVTQYAAQFNRWYPYRQAVHEQTQWPMNLSLGEPRYDDRPKLAPFISLNQTLNCPLIPPIDIAGSRADTLVFGTESYWFGFAFRGPGAGSGMLKLGGRLQFTDSGVPTPLPGWGRASTYSAPLLTSTRYVFNVTQVNISHPDDNNTVTHARKQDEFVGTAEVGGVGVNGRRYTYTRWDSSSPVFGRVDINACFEDLAVRRYEHIEWNPWDERPSSVPAFSDANTFPGQWEAVPPP